MADSDAGTGTGMQKKILGMPMWLVISGGAALVAGLYFWYKNKSASNAAAANNAAASTASTAATSDTPGSDVGEYEAILAQLRDLQGEESEEPSPVPGPAGPTGPAGPPGAPGKPGTPAPPTGGKPPVKAPPPAPAPKPPAPTKRTVTVAPWPAWNSTLWGIAGREYGKSDTTNVNKIYNANSSLINGQEIRHGMSSSQAQQRKWLYPGEVLTIP